MDAVVLTRVQEKLSKERKKDRLSLDSSHPRAATNLCVCVCVQVCVCACRICRDRRIVYVLVVFWPVKPTLGSIQLLNSIIKSQCGWYHVHALTACLFVYVSVLSE